MTEFYDPPTLTGYDESPPTDNGIQEAQNLVKWDTHTSKLGDPLKNFSEAINTELVEAFADTPSKAVNQAELSAISPGASPSGVILIEGRSTSGDGEGGLFIETSSDISTQVTNDPNADVYVPFDSDPTGASGGFVRQNNTVFETFRIGNGVKGNPQTNVGTQIHRDIDDATNPAGTSSHGFNDASYWAEDTFAYNTFGSDLQIGDGTQTTEVLNHVNCFQTTDQIDLNTATLSTHRAFIAQDVMVSGTVSAQNCFTAVDLLGVRDTPGFGVAGFDAGSVVNNQIGINTVIRHGTNPRSAHFAAGSNDAGATLTSGAAVIDCEGPIVNRQNTAATSKTTGSLILTLGGIGCAGAIFGGDDVSAVGATPIVRLRNASNTVIGSMFHNATDLLINNHLANKLKLGLNNVAVFEVHSDRVIPTVDSTLNLGDGSHKWLEVFADNATINTSDERRKKDIKPITDEVLDAWESVKKVSYKWKEGNDLIQHGFIAQRIVKAFADKGIDAFEYDLVKEEELEEDIIKTRPANRQKIEIVKVPVTTYDKVDGELVPKTIIELHESPITEQLKIAGENRMQDHPVMEDYEEEYTETVKTGETLFALRYTQCLVIEAACQCRRADRLEARIEALEK